MSADTAGAVPAVPTSLAGRVLNKIWRETSRPFRPRTWRKLAGLAPKPPAPPPRQPAKPKENRALPKGIPSMITHSEAAFFARCAERSLGAEGQIVDLGCWMGSTAVALAEGIRRGGGDERVRAFDIFLWETWMEREHAKLTYGIYRAGDSFLPEARRIVQQHGHGLVELHQADLTRYHWSGEPIKLLLVDAMKSLPLAQQIARTFSPASPRRPRPAPGFQASLHPLAPPAALSAAGTPDVRRERAGRRHRRLRSGPADHAGGG
jgi:hypothetical protein